MKRNAAVAGRFYQAAPDRLKDEVQRCLTPGVLKEKALGVIAPHAGFMYSGPVAGAVYSSVELSKTIVLLGPNHTGMGARVSLMSSGQWDIPTATFTVDEDLGGRIASSVPHVSQDVAAHMYEHSLEVQLPFIAHFSPDSKIVPITVMNASLKECEEIGRGIGRCIRESATDVLVVASSDMSHYVTAETARRLDNKALEEALKLDPAGLYDVVMKDNISMCGVLPATIMLYSCLERGAREARLIKYCNSGDASGDYGQVVGYAGVIVL